MSEKKNIQAYARAILEILRSLKEVYEQLSTAENAKREALLNRQSKNLQQLVLRQEDLLRESQRYESLLNLTLQDLSRATGQSELRLSQISELGDVATIIKDEIYRLRLQLLEIGTTLRNLALGNEKILQDNIEIFRSLAENLSREHDTGYGFEQRQARSRRPVLVNAAG